MNYNQNNPKKTQIKPLSHYKFGFITFISALPLVACDEKFENLFYKYLKLLFIIILFSQILSGCQSSPLVYYENQEWNYSLEFPNNWELNEDNRVANDISLQATNGLLNRSSARIVLTAGFPNSDEIPHELESAMENYLIAFAGMTHIYKSLEILQVSDIVDSGTHKMIWATVSVPTLDIVEGSNSNQMGQRDEHTFQTINLYILRNNQGQDIVVNVFRGNDESLNLQAEEIIQSIKFINE